MLLRLIAQKPVSMTGFFVHKFKRVQSVQIPEQKDRFVLQGGR